MSQMTARTRKPREDEPGPILGYKARERQTWPCEGVVLLRVYRGVKILAYVVDREGPMVAITSSPRLGIFVHEKPLVRLGQETMWREKTACEWLIRYDDKGPWRKSNNPHAGTRELSHVAAAPASPPQPEPKRNPPTMSTTTTKTNYTLDELLDHLVAAREENRQLKAEKRQLDKELAEIREKMAKRGWQKGQRRNQAMPQSEYVALAEKLKAEIAARQLTLRVAADEMQTTDSTLSRWIRGIDNPSLAAVKRIRAWLTTK